MKKRYYYLTVLFLASISIASAQTQTFTVNGVSFKMVFVKGGTFMMGATSEQEKDAFENEKPVHQVTLSDYHIGETEVTQALWMAVMGYNPSRHKGDNLPVEKVSWDECLEFFSKLESATGKKFRLPTEAEWEFAARGGNKSNNTKYAGGNNLGSVAWYDGNSNDETHLVAKKSPNELGLYDMSGNVWELCYDCYDDHYYRKSPSTNPCNLYSRYGYEFVDRGGSWNDGAWGCRVSARRFVKHNEISFSVGFRLAL